jgi:hypothetical protein
VYCTSCGAQRADHDTICPSCGQRVRTFPAPPPINNYLIPSIAVTLCCCLPAGIVGLVYAAQVNTKIAAGDIEGAKLSAKNAKMWTWIGFAVGAAASVAWFLFGVIGAISGNH